MREAKNAFFLNWNWYAFSTSSYTANSQCYGRRMRKKKNRPNSGRRQGNIWNSPTFTPCANRIYSGAKGLWKSPIWRKITTPGHTALHLAIWFYGWFPDNLLASQDISSRCLDRLFWSIQIVWLPRLLISMSR